ncbi:MAG: hypothetical protein ACHQPI_01250 [Thermoanaerobaculia bacterium]
MRNPMTCPYLKEVVMLYCDACPFKKMVPLDHLVSVTPCLAQDYQACRHFLEAVATAASAAADAAGKEPSDPRPAFFTPSKEVNPS